MKEPNTDVDKAIMRMITEEMRHAARLKLFVISKTVLEVTRDSLIILAILKIVF